MGKKKAWFLLLVLLGNLFVTTFFSIGQMKVTAAETGRDISTLEGYEGSILTSAVMTINGNPITENNPVHVGEAFQIDYKIYIPDALGKNIEDGDYFEFELPEDAPIRLTSEASGELIDPDVNLVFGHYYSDDSGHIRLVFNDNVHLNDDVDGDLQLSFMVDEREVTRPGEIEVLIPGVGSQENDVIYVVSKNQNYIEKTYVDSTISDGGLTTITWRVVINPKLATIHNPVLVDSANNATAYHLKEVYQGNVDLATGNVRDGARENWGVDFDAEGRLVIPKEPLEDAYVLYIETPLNYSAGIYPNSSTVIKNTATLTGDGVNYSATASATVKERKDISKQKTDYDPETGLIDWTITYNPSGYDVPQEYAWFTDDLSQYSTFVEGSLNVEPNKAYEIEVAEDLKSFKFIFKEDIHEPVKITYQSKVTKEGANFVKNSVNSHEKIVDVNFVPEKPSGGEGGETGPTNSSIKKKVSDKQVAEGILGWNITINQERAMLDRWQIVDHVENGEIIANSIWVQDVQGKNILTEKELLADKDYELTYEMSGDKRVGFTLKYNKKTDHHFQIAYDTKVTDSQKNKAIYTYEINKVPGEDEDEASYEPKPDPENWVSLTKSGSFIDSLYSNIDPPEFPAGAKGVSWKILINIGRKKVGTGAKLTDKIPEGQKYVPGSARLEKERWEAGPFEELPAQNVVYNEATNELEVTVPAGVSYMMRLRFDTIFEDQSVFPTGEVKNTAYYEDVNTDRTAVVGSLMTGWQDNALVEKTGGVKTGTKNTMAWNVEVNPLSYHLKNVEVFDKNWVNQRVLPETVQVKKKTGERLQENIDYVFDYTERQFYIKFLNDVREPIDISYDAQIVYPSGSRPGQQIPVKNGITVKGDNFKMESNEVTVTEQVVYPDSSGIIHGKTKELHLIKKDKSNNKPLAGAEFTLYRGKVKDKTKIVDRLVSNQQGEVFFDKLTKDDYLLVETKAPSGYAISQELADGKLYKISDDVPEVQTYDLMNEKTSDERIELKAEKIWKGTPVTKETPDITVYLRANGTVVQEKKLTKANDYKVTFTDLKKQDEKGQLIQYDMFEEDIPHYNGEATQTESGWLFTNTYTEELNIKGDKIWKDYDNAFNTRPDEITLHLYKNGQKEATQVVTPDKNGRWAYEFTNLEKYDSQGKENKYTVVEEKVPGYVGTQNGYDFTNEYMNDETIEIPVMKIWKDYQNTHDTRPNQLKFVLYQDNTKFQELTLSQEDASETNESVWEGKFTDLPKYRNDGGEFEYLVKEEFSDSRYQSEKSAEGNTFTNTYVNNDKVSVSGEKEWINDQNNKLNTRPESITVNLYRNTQGATDMDTFVASQVVKPDASGNWHYQFKDLDKYDEQGRSYVYKVKEDKVPGYESEFEGSTLKNTYQNTEKTAVFGEKIWQDNNDKLGARPTKIKVHLLQNGQKYQEKEIEADASGDWRYSFTDLPKYDEHLDPYLYTIEEDPIEDYTSETQGYNLINHYQNTETTKISIEKIWMNEIVGTDIRPEKVQFFLLQNNGLYREDPYEITPDANGEWKTTLTDLPKYDNNGEAYQYDIQEVTVPDYDSTVEVVPLGDPNTLGFKLTNTKDHSLDTTDLSGVKYWDDHENVFGKRPTQAVFKEKLELYRKTEGTTGIGEQMTEAVPMITDGDTASEWRYTYTDLAKYEAVTNKLYIYTVKELPIDEYTSTQIGDSFINEYRNTEKVKLAVKKEWDDWMIIIINLIPAQTKLKFS